MHPRPPPRVPRKGCPVAPIATFSLFRILGGARVTPFPHHTQPPPPSTPICRELQCVPFGSIFAASPSSSLPPASPRLRWTLPPSISSAVTLLSLHVSFLVRFLFPVLGRYHHIYTQGSSPTHAFALAHLDPLPTEFASVALSTWSSRPSCPPPPSGGAAWSARCFAAPPSSSCSPKPPLSAPVS